ncbi:FAD-dependent thymidylate synthase [Bacillus cereus]|uniref:FAD-dependent thymidylate synthase n=1 Tax=Bacillus cereus TaxID=1396 RepID=UPI00032EF275|nr:FAD-dependent thymidylate synthase [Bacillus cereus]EOO44421.1 hypothetical protein ICK_06196 [Bacillus cereus BAG1X2-2]
MTTKDEKEIKAGAENEAANPKTRTRKQNSTKATKQKSSVSEKTDQLEKSEEKVVLMIPLISDEPDISKYITNLEGDVYAISGLPEEFIATLFAWVSRSPKSFKEHLKTALKELDYESSVGHFGALTEKAKAFHEKWTVGYGHSSVAEHAVAHVGIEKVSRLASAELELSNSFLSITEYSQRYQKPKRGEWHNPFPEYVSHDGPTRDMKANPLHHEFEKFMHESFDAFEQLVELIYTALKRIFVDTSQYKELQAKGDTKGIDRELAKFEKLAFEDARYVLPLAMHTQLGMTANGRAWRDSIAQIGISDHKEVHDLADNLKTEITKVLPVLLKYATPSQYQKNSKKRVESHFTNNTYDSSGRSFAVRLHGVVGEHEAIDEIITHLFIQNEDMTHFAAANLVKHIDMERKYEMIQDMLFEMQHFDTPPESFKQIKYKASFLISEANWHQLLRHNRKTDFTFAKPTTKFGIKIPPRIKNFGFDYILEDIAKKSEELYNKMVNALHKSEAEYVILNAHKRPVTASFDLWEAYHLINLRTSEEAQWDIRETFEELYISLCTVHPTLISKAKRR